MSAQLNAGNTRRGLRSLRDLTQHLTARADDSHAPPVSAPLGHRISPASPICQALVRFFALLRIKPHAPLLVRPPVNSFEFQPCGRTPQAGRLMRWLRHGGIVPPTPSVHRLRLGLPGYLILFAPPAFAPQRRCRPRRLPSPSVFFPISAHFTATPGIPPPPAASEASSSGRFRGLSPRLRRRRLKARLRALYAQ